eukprot:TRINITY_DN24845_c0_g1_i1.p1 TRINITY_DN24845_c0_g1~~TRINITY_DN24845_c0_g1_i1.p1  ORF type:complete len:1503 (+),score=419.36 TRINITY_DN24845_c0_g1_i1:104-4612(+)
MYEEAVLEAATFQLPDDLSQEPRLEAAALVSGPTTPRHGSKDPGTPGQGAEASRQGSKEQPGTPRQGSKRLGSKQKPIPVSPASEEAISEEGTLPEKGEGRQRWRTQRLASLSAHESKKVWETKQRLEAQDDSWDVLEQPVGQQFLRAVSPGKDTLLQARPIPTGPESKASALTSLPEEQVAGEAAAGQRRVRWNAGGRRRKSVSRIEEEFDLEQNAEAAAAAAGAGHKASQALRRARRESVDGETEFEEDSDEEDDDFDFTARKVLMGRPGGYLNLIDEASTGISSYLHYMQEREKAVRYDKHAQEGKRWIDIKKALLVQFGDEGLENDAEEWRDLGVSGRTRWPEGDLPTGGAPLAGLMSALGPCAPPKDLVFEEPPRMPGQHESLSLRLTFCSCFESGNLSQAKVETTTYSKRCTYILLLDRDVNTCGYTQWFYFGVRNGTKGHTATFKIENMSKASSLFSDTGMRPVIYSELSGRGWERGCYNISYYPNSHRRDVESGCAGEGAAFYRTLEFSYTFEFDDDTVFFAYHYPYTYSYLQDFLSTLSAHPYAKPLIKRGVLCKTISGLNCDVVEIDDPTAAHASPQGFVRPLAVVTARVHPGESNASWMMQGFLQFLCSPAPEALALRQACSWLVIPMLNPDGVVQGNYRCSLAGVDLNRCFSQPHRRLHPEIWSLKDRLRNRRVEVYLDFHGHSKQEGIFFYGGRYHGGPCEERNANVRLLPKMCARASSDFKYEGCAFTMTEAKLSTARLVLFMKLGVLQTYTVEASFSSAGETTTDFQEEDWVDSDESAPEEEEDAQEQKQSLSDGQFDSTLNADLLTREDIASVAEAALRQGMAGTEMTLPSVAALNVVELSASLGNTAFRRQAHASRCGSGHKSAPGSRGWSRQVSGASDEMPDFGRQYSGDSIASEASAPPAAMPAGFKGACPSRRQSAQSVYSMADSNATEQPQFSPVGDSSALSDDDNEMPQIDPEVLEEMRRKEFTPARLELAGPTIGRSLAACWQVQRGLRVQDLGLDEQAASGLLEGYEREGWNHLTYNRINADSARLELAKLMNVQLQEQANNADDSDSNPSGDDLKGEAFKKVQRKILQKLKSRKHVRHLPDLHPPEEKAEKKEEQQYRTIIAFGQTVRIPIASSGQAAVQTKSQRASMVKVEAKAAAAKQQMNQQKQVQTVWKLAASEEFPLADDVRDFVNVAKMKPIAHPIAGLQYTPGMEKRGGSTHNEATMTKIALDVKAANDIWDAEAKKALAKKKKAAQRGHFLLPQDDGPVLGHMPGKALHAIRQIRPEPQPPKLTTANRGIRLSGSGCAAAAAQALTPYPRGASAEDTSTGSALGSMPSSLMGSVQRMRSTSPGADAHFMPMVPDPVRQQLHEIQSVPGAAEHLATLRQQHRRRTTVAAAAAADRAQVMKAGSMSSLCSGPDDIGGLVSGNNSLEEQQPRHSSAGEQRGNAGGIHGQQRPPSAASTRGPATSRQMPSVRPMSARLLERRRPEGKAARSAR